jgi:PKHD-type hydroxylase
MYAHWYQKPGLLTPKECKRVISHAKWHYKPTEAVVGHGSNARSDKMRSSTIRWLSYSDLDLLWLRLRIEEMILVANRESFGFTLQPSFTEIQFTEYKGASEDHYDWHEDNSACMKKPMDRKLSFVLQLSDPADYEGGKFELHPSADPLPATAYTRQGDAMLFRSGLRHRVLPVTRGTRYSLVTWVHGPRS